MFDTSIERFEEVQEIPVGTFVRRSESAKATYIRLAYNASAKAYPLQDTEDMNRYIHVKKGKKLFINFEY